MLSLQNLPDTALKIVLRYLHINDKKNLRLLSVWFSYKISSLDSSLRRWKFIINHETFKTIKSRLDVFQAKNEYSIRLKLNLIFHASMTRSDETRLFTQNLLTEWKDDILGLELSVIGDEAYLLEPNFIFTSLQQLNIKVQDTWDSPTGLHGLEEVRKCLMTKHARNLEKLEFHNAYRLHVQPTFPCMNNLCLNNCDLGTLNTMLEKCGNNLNGLEMFQCFGEETTLNAAHLVNLKHLWIESCDHLCTSLVQQLSSQLITLKIRSTDIFLFQAKFLHLEFLWVENVSNEVALSLIGRCAKTVKHLFARGIYSSPETAVKILNLTDMIVDGKGPWCLEMIKKNAATLKFLAILYPGRNLKNLTCDFPMLEKILLPDCEDIETISKIKSKCLNSSVEFIVTRTSVCEAVRSYAKENFPFYKISDDLLKRGYF